MDEDLKKIARTIIETGAVAKPGPWIAAPDCVASLDPEIVAKERAEAREDARKFGERQGWTAEEIERYAEGQDRHYGGGALVCESISPTDRAFVAACREAPRVAVRMLELETAVADMTAQIRDLRRKVGDTLAPPTGAPAEPKP